VRNNVYGGRKRGEWEGGEKDTLIVMKLFLSKTHTNTHTHIFTHKRTLIFLCALLLMRRELFHTHTPIHTHTHPYTHKHIHTTYYIHTFGWGGASREGEREREKGTLFSLPHMYMHTYYVCVSKEERENIYRLRGNLESYFRRQQKRSLRKSYFLMKVGQIWSISVIMEGFAFGAFS
jgi:hypothetical protein